MKTNFSQKKTIENEKPSQIPGLRVADHASDANPSLKQLHILQQTMGNNMLRRLLKSYVIPEQRDLELFSADPPGRILPEKIGITSPLLQRQPSKPTPKKTGVTFWYSVSIQSLLTPEQLLLEFIKQYHHLSSDEEAEKIRVERNWHWTGKPVQVTEADLRKGYVLLKVTDNNLVSADPATKQQQKEYFGKLSKETQGEINAEADRLFWEKTNYKPGQKLGKSADDQKMAKYWIALRDELIRQRRAIDALPPALQKFLFTENSPQTISPKDYATVLRMAEKLAALSETELADYKSKVNAQTTDWLEFEASVDRYLAARAERKEDAEKRERVKTKLFGMEELYRKYREYEEARYTNPFPVVDDYGKPLVGNIRYQEQKIAALEAELNTNLPRYGFSSIAEFGQAIRDYEAAFEKETVAIAFDILAKYEHVLYEEEKKYQNPAHASALYQSLSQTQAKKYYEEEDETRLIDALILPHAHTGYSPGALKIKDQLKENARQAHNQAETEVLSVAGAHPLLRNADFDREELAKADQNEVQSIMLDYINARRQDIEKTRRNLREKPQLVYKLDELMKASYSTQEISKGTIFDLIVQDRRKKIQSEELIIKLAIAVFAIAVGLLTFGGGTVATLAAVASLGIGAYQAIEEFREYETMSSAHGAQLLSDDPSMAWVIVAVVGAGIDLAGAALAIKAMVPAAKTFNTTGDIVQFEKDLSKITEISDQLRQNVLRAAEAELQYKQAVQSLLSTSGRLNVAVVPGLQEFGKLVVVAYYAVKRGIIRFEQFLLELKAAKIIDKVEDLTPEQLTTLKKAFQEGFEKTKEIQYTTSIKWGIQQIPARPYGKGFFGKRIPQSDPRVNAYELKINPYDESFYLPHPGGGYVQYENLVTSTVQDGKLITRPKSFYHVEDMPPFARDKVLEEARRQVAAADAAGYKVEWLVSDPSAEAQMRRLFQTEGIPITITSLPE